MASGVVEWLCLLFRPLAMMFLLRDYVYCMGGELKVGSGLQITKLALGSVLGSWALMGPILKLERPTPAGGIFVALPPAGAGVFAKGDCVFADVASDGQRLVGQGGQGE